MTSQSIKIALLEPNEGQINGIPSNPRFIKDKDFEKLKKSMRDLPEMLELREVLVYKQGEKYIVLGGNQRFRAAKEIGLNTLPAKVIPAETPVEKLRAIVLLDNKPYGENDWSKLNAEWDKMELAQWDMMEFAEPFTPFTAPQAQYPQSPAPAPSVRPTTQDQFSQSTSAGAPPVVEEFQPTLNPSAIRQDIDEEDIAKEAKRLNSQFSQANQAGVELVGCVCPECGHEFTIKA